ncbi:MAG: hypothetical protein WD063_17460 [Pirellulales bacterium]
MRNFAIACVVLMLFAATASAGDQAVSKSTLSSMGLTSMQQMSDTDGMAVRGKGVSAAVWGGSQANWSTFNGAQHSANNYEAGASWLGPVGAGAQGQSLSFAGQIEVLYAQDPTGFALQVHAAGGIAGGGASASAF